MYSSSALQAGDELLLYNDGLIEQEDSRAEDWQTKF
jgi:hypothetical protein